MTILKELEKHYQKEEKLGLRSCILLISGLTNEGTYKTSIFQILNSANFRQENGNQWLIEDIEKELGILVRKKLMVQKKDYRNTAYSINPDIRKEQFKQVLLMKQDERISTTKLRMLSDAIQRKHPYYYWSTSVHSIEREMMRAIIINDFEKYKLQLQKSINSGAPKTSEFLSLNDPFDLELFNLIPSEFQQHLIQHWLKDCITYIKPIDKKIIKWAVQQLDTLEDKDSDLRAIRLLLIEYYILKGKWKKATQLAAPVLTEPEVAGAMAMMDFLQENNKAALLKYEDTWKVLKKISGNNRAYFETKLFGVIYPLALFKEEPTLAIPIVKRIIHQNRNDRLYSEGIKAMLIGFQYDIDAAHKLLNHNFRYEPLAPALTILLKALGNQWFIRKNKTIPTKVLKQYFLRAEENGFKWYAMEFAHLLSKQNKKTYEPIFNKYQKKLNVISLLNIKNEEDAWQYSLKVLSALNPNKSNLGSTRRLVYLVNFDQLSIEPREQSLGKTGKWTKGRKVSLTRLRSGEIDCMTPQDTNVAATFEHGWNSISPTMETFRALARHPLLFLQKSPSTSCEIIEEKAELIVRKKGKNFEITFSVDIDGEGVQLIKETNTRYKVVQIDAAQKKIANILGSQGLKIPQDAENQLSETMESLSPLVPIKSAVAIKGKSVPIVEANTTPYVQLIPIGDGFKAEIFVKPFTSVPPYLKMGKGEKNIFSTIDGQTVQCNRDLKAEKANLDALLEACPSLKMGKHTNEEWLFDDPEPCLVVLMELGKVENPEPVIEWPKGEKLQVTQELGLDDFYVTIAHNEDWFSLEGEVRLESQEVIDMKRLIDMVENSTSNFVELSEGKFLALTESFRKRIKQLNAAAQYDGKDFRLHPLAAWGMQDLEDELADMKVAKEWKEQIQNLKDGKRKRFRVPKDFKAELRPYQKLGFQWLSRLAHWKVGACLADDMGLGKTIQALAVILQRAANGPTLVVAPSSVLHNWKFEAERFAPKLKPQIFGKGDRQQVLKDMGKYDLLISSYGLMQQESKHFSEVHWETIVLDEAQNIKNRLTKRSKAAMELKSNFKMITTGTPIENHLAEFWNLFHFLNPGLLGSISHFHEKFAIPIEKHRDDDKRKQLQKIIKPFILRRKKDQVLKDLPPKTEITLKVDLSTEEKAFYEAMRQTAIEKIELAEEDTGGARHLKILAEIMKLRQACCHPQLIDDKIKVGSSKLALFESVVDELLENGHKALVFSQFVKHLTILRNTLDKKGISYQYLDGSTPTKKRKDYVDAFQNGEGDLFLISLKAGGVGLNLTAADYVIHMDPWWNPAVEDQASDRAHRIGQKRPVTIYRLIASNTIEEKIVRLHNQKKELADSLLAGTEASAKLSADELLNFIKEG